MRSLWRFLKDGRGSSTVMVALALMAMMGMGALAVDLGYVFSTRSEVQKVADDDALTAPSKTIEGYFTSSSIPGGKPGGGNFGSKAGHVVLVK